MKITAIAATALLALTLAGCAPAGDTGTDSTDTTEESTETETGGGDLVTLAGSGNYTVGADAPYGGYELDGADTQPDGCTWSVLDENGQVQFSDQGIVVFLTEENASFQTDGCPDWVQFE